MSMILTNCGKAILYLNNWGNGKNNLGNNNYPEIFLSGGNGSDITYKRCALPSPNLVYIYNYFEYPYSQIPYELYLFFSSDENNIDENTTYYDISINANSPAMNLIDSNIYNKNIEKISYNNPIIMGLTNTYQYIGQSATTIQTIGLCAPCKNMRGTTNNPILIAADGHLNIPLSPGDRITFTVIIQ